MNEWQPEPCFQTLGRQNLATPEYPAVDSRSLRPSAHVTAGTEGSGIIYRDFSVNKAGF